MQGKEFMYKKAWASLWNQRKLPQGNTVSCIQACMNLSPSVPEDKKEKTNMVPSRTVRTNKTLWHLILPEIGLTRKGGLSYWSYPNICMWQNITSLLIRRDIRCKIFLTLNNHAPTAPATAMHAAVCLAGPKYCLLLPISHPPGLPLVLYPQPHSVSYFNSIWVFRYLTHIALVLFPVVSILNTDSTTICIEWLLSKSGERFRWRPWSHVFQASEVGFVTYWLWP